MSEVEKKNGYCVRWNVEKGCVSPSKIIYLCSGYNGPGRCKFDGDLKVEFKQRLPFPLVIKTEAEKEKKYTTKIFFPWFELDGEVKYDEMVNTNREIPCTICGEDDHCAIDHEIEDKKDE